MPFPAAVLGLYGVVTALLPVAVGANWFLLSSDSSSHLLLAEGVQQQGNLDYSGLAYPRGWHTVVGTLMSASGQSEASPASLTPFIRISSLATWFLYVLLVLATVLCTQRLAASSDLSERATGWVAAGAGATMLTGAFFTFTMAMGFQTTILLALVLIIGATESMEPTSPARFLTISTICFVGAAHAWQLALPVAGIPMALAFWRFWRTQASTYRRVIGTASTLVTCALAVPPMWAVATQVGISHAATPGGVGRLPVEWLLLGVAGLLILRKRSRS